MMQFPSGAITGMGVSAKERLVGVISEDGGCAAENVCKCFTSSYIHMHVRMCVLICMCPPE